MFKSYKAIPFFVVALFATTALKAETVPGYYVDLGAGLTFIPETKVATAANGLEGVFHGGFNPGLNALGGVGYAFAPGFRLEGEISYSHTSLDKIKNIAHSSGALNSTDFFANGFYDINLGMPFTPYVGLGVGLALNDASDFGSSAIAGTYNYEDVNLAYQAIAGVAVQLDPNWAVTADYRYITSPDVKFKNSIGAGKLDINSNNLVVGVRYSFGQPEAMVAHAAAPMVHTSTTSALPVVEEPGHYVVFFDFAKHSLTPEAKKILALAAKDYKSGHYVKIVVTGNTDTVGTNQKNDVLSVKRANAVKAELIKLGLKKTDIETKGVGKSDLLVKTKDGVKEVQNRRAEVVLESK